MPGKAHRLYTCKFNILVQLTNDQDRSPSGPTNPRVTQQKPTDYKQPFNGLWQRWRGRVDRVACEGVSERTWLMSLLKSKEGNGRVTQL